MIDESPAVTLAKLLKDKFELTNVFSRQIYGSVHDQEKPIYLVTDINTVPEVLGSNRIMEVRHQLQVQIYFPKNATENIETVATNLYINLQEYGYYLFEKTGTLIVPETGQLLTTLKFNYEKEL